jgi:hypothetical protein
VSVPDPLGPQAAPRTNGAAYADTVSGYAALGRHGGYVGSLLNFEADQK